MVIRPLYKSLSFTCDTCWWTD